MVKNDIYRILDANLNRSSEALRVLEDWARFSKDSPVLSEKLKKIRHEINNTFSDFPNLIMNRESVYDVGREIKNKNKRASVRDIIRANSKRLEESLRVLSEYGELIGGLAAVGGRIRELEKFRYEVYTIEKELLINEKLMRLHDAQLYLVTNRDGFTNDKDFLYAIEKAIEGGVDIIQLREKNESERKILELAKEIKKLIKGTEVLFIVNDRIDLALASDADGVHLGQNDMPVSEARKITPDGFIIGLSTHSALQGQRAIGSKLETRNSPAKGGSAFGGKLETPDYVGVGPVFPTPTKPDYKPAGLEYVSWASKNIKDVPFFAIGGIDETNIDDVINAGAKRVAIVRAIMNAKDPYKIAKHLKEKLQTNTIGALCTN